MRTPLKILTTACLFLFCLTASGQNEIYDPYYNPYPNEFEVLVREVQVADTLRDTVYVYLSHMDSITKYFGLTFDEYVAQFMKFKQERDTLETISDNLLYMNYFLPLLDSGEGFLKRRIVTREYSLKYSADSLSLDVIRLRDLEIEEDQHLQADFMLSCYGSENTANFLSSPTQIKSSLGQIFTEIVKAEGKIKGLNLYFPDFDFKEKKAMAQFVKSVSILIDSLPQKEIRNLRYYISFDEQQGDKHRTYLACLTQMADSVLLFRQTNADNTIPRISVIDHDDAKAQSFLNKFLNQFYLAKFYIKSFPEYNPEETLMTNINEFIEADYPYNHWENYFFILISILVLIVVSVLLYRFNPTFSSYLNKNIDYTYSLIIILAFEMLLLTACMFEGMSEENVFTIGAENRYFILILPLLFIFIVPMMKTLGKRRQLP